MSVRLNRFEIRQRAISFAADWRGVTRENAEAQTFWNEWFPVFGVGRREFTNFEFAARRQSTGRQGAFRGHPALTEAPHRRTSKTRLNGVSAARRKLN